MMVLPTFMRQVQRKSLIMQLLLIWIPLGFQPLRLKQSLSEVSRKNKLVLILLLQLLHLPTNESPMELQALLPTGVNYLLGKVKLLRMQMFLGLHFSSRINFTTEFPQQLLGLLGKCEAEDKGGN
uniref:Uncharacterized protein LOC104236644 n=1 Tax=Nicotiana sylvestris TaxID=4096 RepID=A0A1U7X9Y4_NICSY|nr:PREDICTED: uncharacterized protein LOC104236644 [Nicotiana sylvestris]